jgi:hypothetical protein
MNDQGCAGVVVYDHEGNYVKRYGCEVHLFDDGICPWQATMIQERGQSRHDP